MICEGLCSRAVVREGVRCQLVCRLWFQRASRAFLQVLNLGFGILNFRRPQAGGE